MLYPIILFNPNNNIIQKIDNGITQILEAKMLKLREG